MLEPQDNLTDTNRKKSGNLTYEQRKELMGLMKRMLPPVPSSGIVDIRFSFWFIRYWYIVIIFGKDTRNQFKSMDKGYMDKGLTAVAKSFTYILLIFIMVFIILFMMYLLKSYLGINLFPNKHLIDILNERLW